MSVVLWSTVEKNKPRQRVRGKLRQRLWKIFARWYWIEIWRKWRRRPFGCCGVGSGSCVCRRPVAGGPWIRKEKKQLLGRVGQGDTADCWEATQCCRQNSDIQRHPCPSLLDLWIGCSVCRLQIRLKLLSHMFILGPRLKSRSSPPTPNLFSRETTRVQKESLTTRALCKPQAWACSFYKHLRGQSKSRGQAPHQQAGKWTPATWGAEGRLKPGTSIHYHQEEFAGHWESLMFTLYVKGELRRVLSQVVTCSDFCFQRVTLGTWGE